MAEKINVGKFINNLDAEDLSSEKLQGVVNNVYAKAIKDHKQTADIADDNLKDLEKETVEFVKSNHDRLKAHKNKPEKDIDKDDATAKDKVAKEINESFSIKDFKKQWAEYKKSGSSDELEFGDWYYQFDVDFDKGTIFAGEPHKDIMGWSISRDFEIKLDPSVDIYGNISKLYDYIETKRNILKAHKNRPEKDIDKDDATAKDKVAKDLNEDFASEIERLHADDYVWNKHNLDFTWLYNELEKVLEPGEDLEVAGDPNFTIANLIRRMPKAKQKEIYLKMLEPVVGEKLTESKRVNEGLTWELMPESKVGATFAFKAKLNAHDMEQLIEVNHLLYDVVDEYGTNVWLIGHTKNDHIATYVPKTQTLFTSTREAFRNGRDLVEEGFARKLKPGDAIICKGEKATVGNIIDQYYDKDFIDIEFEDDKGNYRSWKSDVDGGKVVYKESKSVNGSKKLKEARYTY